MWYTRCSSRTGPAPDQQEHGQMGKSSTARAKPTSIYSVHLCVAMVQEGIIGLPKKTGRTLDEWIRLVEDEVPASDTERRDWLKAEYGLGTNTAWWIADRAARRGLEDGDPAEYLKA